MKVSSHSEYTRKDGGHVLDRVNRTGRNQGRLLIGTALALLGLLSVVSCSDPLRSGLPGTGGSAGGGGLPGTGGQVGTGGASTLGGSGGVTTGGVTGTFGTEVRCPALPCPANPCPEGDTPLALFDCNCSGPCGCWQCVSASELSTGGTVSSGGASGSSGIGGTISHGGGTSGPSGSGGVVSFGGVSGSAGGSTVGGASGSGGSSVTCIPPPCAPAVCPDGYIVAPSNDCNCSGPCGCPCGCWTCIPAAESPDAAPLMDAPVSDGPSTVGDAKVPLQHRSTSASCPSQRGPAPQDCTTGTCTGQPYPSQVSGLPLTCSSDSQCTAGVNGRCFPPKPEWAGGCSYDECFADSSCGAKTPCLCRGSSTDNSANICDVGGNCAVDSDCGPGGYCSPSMESCASTDPNIKAEASNGPSPYYCHTASDLCINDSDCGPPDAATTPFPALNVCAYSTQDNRWECTTITCGHF